MAVTANGTPYVESSDLVANYPGVSLALANHIDDLPAAVLQVVRATDSTDRTTTSGTFVDVTGMAVTITPTKNTSAIIIVGSFIGSIVGAADLSLRIADAANNAISGAEDAKYVFNSGTATRATPMTLWAYATPATLSATTYKLQFKTTSAVTGTIYNSLMTGQMYAIEVSA